MYHHFHLINFAIKKELSEIYTSMAMRSLALSMIGIFVPIYLLVELRSLSLVIFYYLIYSIFFALFSPIGAKLSSKFGFKHSMLISTPILILALLSLMLIKTNPKIFFITAILHGITMGIFWTAFHIDFSKSSDKRHRSQEVSIWYASSLLMAVAGPVIGGLILTVSNFTTLFIISSVLLLGSITPLFLSKDQHVPSKITLKNIISQIKTKDNLVFASSGVRDIVETVFWPIFIFAIIKEYFNLGVLSSVTTLVSAFTIMIIGKFSDKVGKKKVLRAATVIDSITWLIRGAASTIAHVFAISIASQLSISAIAVPFTALTYDKASKNRVEYLVAREISVCFGRILILLFTFITSNLISTFVITGMTSFFYLLF